MATGNLDHHDLSTAALGGLVREDVMEKIWLIDRFPLPFTDLCAKDTSGNKYKEFTVDELGAPATDNAVVDGADTDGSNDTVIGNRQGNYHQISTKTIQVSHSANASNSIGRQGSLSYQISRGQQRLRRDVEAQMLTNQASVNPTDTVAGVSGGFQAWMKTNVVTGATGSVGGFNFTTGLVDAMSIGTAAALTETNIRNIAQQIYEEGGNTYCIMGTPTVIRLLSEYLFTSSARIATQTNYDQGTNQDMASTAYGSNNVFVTDFGQILRMKANRLQQPTATDVSTLFFIDNTKIRQSFLIGYRTFPLGRSGLAEKRTISVQYTLLVTNEKAHGCIAAIDESAAVTA